MITVSDASFFPPEAPNNDITEISASIVVSGISTLEKELLDAVKQSAETLLQGSYVTSTRVEVTAEILGDDMHLTVELRRTDEFRLSDREYNPFVRGIMTKVARIRHKFKNVGASNAEKANSAN